jgi:hypothetical protein
VNSINNLILQKMKKLLLLSAIILFSGFLVNAQKMTKDFEYTFKDLSPREKKIAIIENQKLHKMQPAGEKYMKDSTYGYKWNKDINDWDPVPYSKIKLVYNSKGQNTDYNEYRWNETLLKWVDRLEYHIIYDDNGNMTEYIQNDYDTATQSWMPYEHDTLIYVNNILVEEAWYFYNPVNNTWIKGLYYKYNSSGALIEYYYLSWYEETYVIEGGYKDIYTLNLQNLPVETINQSFDTLTDTWFTTMKNELSYENDTILLNEVLYLWNSIDDLWTVYQQSIYTYTDNLKTGILTQEWTSGIWVDDSRISFEYNSNNLITKELYQNWNGVAWVNYTQTLYSYDSSNLLTERLYQNYLNNNWANSRLYGYTFDGQGNNTVRLYKYWSYSTGLLTNNSYQYFYTYNSNNVNTETIYQKWNTTDLDWMNYYKTLHYYSLHPYIAVEEVDAGSITVYPNPALNKLFVNGLTGTPVFSICDMTGKLIFSGRITGNQIDISNLTTGMYTLKAKTSRGIILKKFVKQ